MKVALVEVNHWHVPLYLDALKQSGVEVVGVTDSDGIAGQAIADRFKAPLYKSHRELLAAQKSVDLAFVFGRHLDMPVIAADLIERGIPFAIEKPCAVTSKAVLALAAQAEAKGVYVAVPFILRLSDTLRIIKASEGSADGGLEHAHFRFIAGSPDRYRKANVPWMLDPAQSGGGPLLNVGIHFVDLFTRLAGAPVVSVSALAHSNLNHLPIEDFIAVRMQTASGAIGTLECGYSFPSDPQRQRDFALFLRSRRAYYQSEGDTLVVRSAANGKTTQRIEPTRYETDVYYGEFVKRVLADLAERRAPIAGLRDVAHCLRLIEAAYASARQGGVAVEMKS